MRTVLIAIVLMGYCLSTQAQTDSGSVQKPARKHSPKVATWLSVALPGAGQVYNKKNWWWKLPIIYGGGAALVYGATFYNKNYKEFSDAYAFRVRNNVEFNDNPRFDQFQTQTLLAIRNNYRQSRDEMIIGMVILYTLQVVDAAVEAHFFDFNINDDLSLNIQPNFIPVGPMASTGIQLTINFSKH